MTRTYSAVEGERARNRNERAFAAAARAGAAFSRSSTV
jgi:hypothetical protein